MAWLCLFLLGGIAQGSSRDQDMSAIWQQMGLLQFNQAHDALRGLIQEYPEDRQVRYALAVSLLNVQPRRMGQIEEARSILEQLIDQRAGDRFEPAAMFFLARIAQGHLTSPDFDLAGQYYRRLIQAHPESYFGQLAVVRLAGMDLLRHDADPAVVESRFAQMERYAPQMTLPALRRAYHLTMANACIYKGDRQEAALRHLLAAGVDDIERPQQRADKFVQIAELARALGDRELARAWYIRFLEDFPRDLRHHMISRRLAELEGDDQP